ncbi:MAG TPA: ester cyclase [Methanomassiliicoccaceae archaeon]|nr:ester cyclase [Methanomassiliicoccaceae archaeon]
MAGTITWHPEENRLLVLRFYDEFLNTGDLDHADELLAYDVEQHSMLDLPDGWPGFQLAMASWYSAFPDLHFDVQDSVAEKDMVWVRSIVRGTHTGTFRGKAPTGRRFEIWQLDAYRLKDGKIVEHWDMVDIASLFHQLDLVPAEPDDLLTNEDA